MEGENFISNVTTQIKLDTKRKLEYLARQKDKKLARFLREILETITEGVTLPGPGEYVSSKPFKIPPEIVKPESDYKPKYVKNATSEVRDRDYRDEINPDVLRPNPNDKWMNEFTND